MSAAIDPIVQSSARWFWWIAGLSLVNVVLFHAGSDVSFVMGLAMTTLANVMFSKTPIVAVMLTVITVGFYFLMGLYGQRHKLWAFYVGLVVYVIDALIYAAFQDWMSIAFHALAAYFIFKGIQRIRELERAPVVATTEA